MKSLVCIKFRIAVLSLALLMGTAEAALPQDVRNDREFIAWMNSLTDQVAQDEHYQRIPLDNESLVDEFTVVLHEVFRGRRTDAEFIDWVSRRYPGHGYEAATILRLLHVQRKSPAG